MGGGVFLVPLLVLFIGLPARAAVAAGLVGVIATSSSVAGTNVEKGTANMRLGMTLELATVAGAILGALVAGYLPARVLIGLFGAMQAVVAYLLWRGPAKMGAQEPVGISPAPGPLDGEYFDDALGKPVAYRLRRLPLGMGVSFIAGGISGLLGVGGGVFKVPALHLYCGMPMKAATATSNFMIGVTASASAFLYFSRGDVNEIPTALVVLGVLAGSRAGVALSRRVQDVALRRTFAALLVVLCAQMLWRAWHG